MYAVPYVAEMVKRPASLNPGLLNEGTQASRRFLIQLTSERLLTWDIMEKFVVCSSKEGIDLHRPTRSSIIRKKITHHVIIYKLQEVPNSQKPERRERKNVTSIPPFEKKVPLRLPTASR